MDRFKFRVWNNRSWDSDDFGKVYYDAEKTYDFLEGNPNIPASSFGNLVESDEWIVEQCTGLKDKNGKLIYEGDIVKYHYDWEDEIKPVFFDTISACYGVKICKDFILPFTNGLDNIEVIGNIHENKDLLEANND